VIWYSEFLKKTGEVVEIYQTEYGDGINIKIDGEKSIFWGLCW